MNKIFISYVRNNSEAVDRICEELKNNNIDYWIDREQIKLGTLWKTAIKDAINDGAYFLACFSREYEERAETHMNEEIILAVEILRRKHFNSGWFIPVKLSACDIPPYDIGDGSTLKDIQYLEFHKNWDTEIKRLIDIIKREEDLEQTDTYAKYAEKEYIYRGLKSLIEKGDGIGFHNADQGHPVYLSGASGKLHEMLEYADSPEKNHLFQMLSKVTRELKELGIEEYRFNWWYDFSEWKDFCKFAVAVYNKKHGYT